MEMNHILDSIIDKASETIPVMPEDYEKDGKLYCGKCNTPKQAIISFNGVTRKPMCLCKCAAEQKRKEDEQREQAQLQLKIEKYRKMGFLESDMGNWNFENDDNENPKLSNAMRSYVEHFPELLKIGKGLLLYGNVGTGKTYFACMVANALIDKGYPCLVTNFARLTNTIQGKYDDKQEYIDSLNKFALLVIDDLGAERQSEYMQEMVFNIIDSRYRSGLPFIITTNLDIAEIKAPTQIGNARIYDRILERCFPIEVSGKSRRKKAVRETYTDMKGLLGL